MCRSVSPVHSSKLPTMSNTPSSVTQSGDASGFRDGVGQLIESRIVQLNSAEAMRE